MKVAVYYNNSDIRTEEMPIPEIRPGELLVKVMASGICGSDVMEWYRVKKAPLVLGHEIAGTVVEVGEGVDGYRKGDRVFVTHHVPCEACLYCVSGNETMCETLRTTNFFPGGFAEYIRVPKINVENGTLLLPKEISYEEGTFIEPLGCVVRGQRIAEIKKGQTVLVLGSGISGLLHIQLAKVRGAGKIVATDIDEYRLKAAKRFGADVVLNAKDDVPMGVLKSNENRLADRVIVCTGAPSAIKQALQSVDRGGTILFFAPTEPGVEVPIHIDELWTAGITLKTSYGAVKKDLEEAMELIKRAQINVKDMITHRLSLSETGKGFQIFSSGKGCIKVMIKPHG
ncbi:MAG: zinc-dependent dehydrogenase [Candidatus Hydrothermarchaeales archaeon]